MPSTMELMQNDDMMARYNTYDLSSGSSKTRWYMRRNNIRWLIIGGVIILVAAAVFLAGYYSGVGARRQLDDTSEKVTSEPQIEELPPVIWNGSCPKLAPKCPDSFEGIPPLLLISLDGFRPDYLHEYWTPTLYNIFNCGTRAPFMYPVYPSKTFASHFSQVTGLNPASHGIIDNSMYDPVKNESFRPGNVDPFWWEKEPIWTTCEKEGKKTALYFWPGSDVKINGILPTYYKKYNKKIPFQDRVDQVLKWLDLPADKRPSFLTLYFSEPDVAGHRYGAKAIETKQAAAKVDKMIARLFSGLQKREIAGCINIMIMSDHGMANIECNQVVEIQSYINITDVYSTLSTMGRLRPKDVNNTAAIDNIISQLECQIPQMRVYKKEQLPVRLHYADNLRIEPIILDIDSGWTVTSKSKDENIYCSGGSHGYDNLFPDMRAIFMAHGPSFKKDNEVKPFINTELYELMAELINITANPNNGTKGSLHHFLNFPSTLPEVDQPLSPPIPEIPTDPEEYGFRIYAASCSCKQKNKQKMVENITESNAKHLPFGMPHSLEEEAKLQILYNEDYIVAYDIKYRLPMWVSFTIEGAKNISGTEAVCWTGDARIGKSNTPECSNYNESIVTNQNIFQRPLYLPYFSDVTLHEQASYVTNSVPKFLNHTKILEEPFYQVLANWAEHDELNVVMGPAFDLFATGIKPDVGTIMRTHEKFGPLVVPTHYFAVVTWCEENLTTLRSCNSSHLETTAFLLPNTPFQYNCESPNEMIAKNRARVVDVEKLTGLSFYTSLPIYEAIRLRTLISTRVPS